MRNNSPNDDIMYNENIVTNWNETSSLVELLDSSAPLAKIQPGCVLLVQHKKAAEGAGWNATQACGQIFKQQGSAPT